MLRDPSVVAKQVGVAISSNMEAVNSNSKEQDSTQTKLSRISKTFLRSKVSFSRNKVKSLRRRWTKEAFSSAEVASEGSRVAKDSFLKTSRS